MAQAKVKMVVKKPVVIEKPVAKKKAPLVWRKRTDGDFYDLSWTKGKSRLYIGGAEQFPMCCGAMVLTDWDFSQDVPVEDCLEFLEWVREEWHEPPTDSYLREDKQPITMFAILNPKQKKEKAALDAWPRAKRVVEFFNPIHKHMLVCYVINFS